jgi:uncharacterized membrane protein YheB (UPF0754 family)
MIFRPLERKRYLGVFPFQGLFPARQAEISREYAEMMASEVLRPSDLIAHLDPVGVAQLKQAAIETAEREAAPLFDGLSMMLGSPVTAEARRASLTALLDRLAAAAPTALPALEARLHERLGIAGTIERELAAMPKLEFERVLRGVFEEDEWILVTLGGVLGGAIGMGQAGIVLALQ